VTEPGSAAPARRLHDALAMKRFVCLGMMSCALAACGDSRDLPDYGPATDQTRIVLDEEAGFTEADAPPLRLISITGTDVHFADHDGETTAAIAPSAVEAIIHRLEDTEFLELDIEDCTPHAEDAPTRRFDVELEAGHRQVLYTELCKGRPYDDLEATADLISKLSGYDDWHGRPHGASGRAM
jgi:hypothetical protein